MLQWLRISVLACALLATAVIAHLPLGVSPALSRSEPPQLRPSFLLDQSHGEDRAIGDGWVVSAQEDRRVSGPTSAYFRLFNLADHRWNVIRPALLGPRYYVMNVVVSHDWLAWIQSPNIQSAGGWQLCSYSIASGQEWIVDSAQAEGTPASADQSGIGDEEIALHGDVLVWTVRQFLGQHGGRSLVEEARLTTRRKQTLAAVANAKPAAVFGWPTTDGRYVAWDRSTQATPSTETDTVELFDLRTSKMVARVTASEASEPALGYGYLAWKRGPRFGDSAGIHVLDMQGGRAVDVPVKNSARPSLGPCLLAYQVALTDGDGLFDLCHQRGVTLTTRQKQTATGWGFSSIVLAGRYAIMNGGNPNTTAHIIGVFYFSAQYPLSDFYH